jgi:hypothetical protein
MKRFHVHVAVTALQDSVRFYSAMFDAAPTVLRAQACCYARSDEYWIADPQGIGRETFRTLESIPVFGEPPVADTTAATCCVPSAVAGESCCAA